MNEGGREGERGREGGREWERGREGGSGREGTGVSELVSEGVMK